MMQQCRGSLAERRASCRREPPGDPGRSWMGLIGVRRDIKSSNNASHGTPCRPPTCDLGCGAFLRVPVEPSVSSAAEVKTADLLGDYLGLYWSLHCCSVMSNTRLSVLALANASAKRGVPRTLSTPAFVRASKPRSQCVAHSRSDGYRAAQSSPPAVMSAKNSTSSASDISSCARTAPDSGNSAMHKASWIHRLLNTVVLLRHCIGPSKSVATGSGRVKDGEGYEHCGGSLVVQVRELAKGQAPDHHESDRASHESRRVWDSARSIASCAFS